MLSKSIQIKQKVKDFSTLKYEKVKINANACDCSHYCGRFFEKNCRNPIKEQLAIYLYIQEKKVTMPSIIKQIAKTPNIKIEQKSHKMFKSRIEE